MTEPLRCTSLLLSLALSFPSLAHAATIDAASCQLADVQSAVDGAADGDTVRVPVGDCTWDDAVDLPTDRGLTLACATEGACNITRNGTAISFDSPSGDDDRLHRVTGFHFVADSPYVIWFIGRGEIARIRIDHNTFDLAPESIAIFFGETMAVGWYYGVLDHNVVRSTGSVSLLEVIGALDDTPPPSPLGTANNLFVEDNEVLIDTMTNAGRGCMDSWASGSIVWRHNHTLNCLVTSHGVTHAGGPQNLELYDNRLEVGAGSAGTGVEDGYRLFHHQGSGEMIAFGNRFTAYMGRNGDPLELTHYRSAGPTMAGYDDALGRCDGTNARDGNRAPTSTYFGYPCWHQPGRDFAGNLVPIYVWDNAWASDGEGIDLLVADPWSEPAAPHVEDHIRPDRDYYNAVSSMAQTSPTAPFDGTTGMGFGTLANRPTTCTTNPDEPGGGVGYFATDEGPDGTLYRCSETNVWTMFYRPYDYPHPLTLGDVPRPDAGMPMDAGARDGGSSGTDGGARADGGPGASPSGCGCAAAPRGRAPLALLLVLSLLVATRRR